MTDDLEDDFTKAADSYDSEQDVRPYCEHCAPWRGDHYPEKCQRCPGFHRVRAL